MKLAKIFRSGGSFVVAIPPEIMEALKCDRGDQVVWILRPDGTVSVLKARMDLFVQQAKEVVAHG